MNVGIVGYGAYIPRYRITVETIAQAWEKESDSIKANLGIEAKSVPGKDEDSATIAIEATKNALLRAQIDPTKIGVIYVGSESHPYAVKPTATIVGDVIGIGNNYTAADMEFACKAGTAAMQAALGLVASSMATYGLAIGTDTAQAKPGDILEYSAAAGGAAFILGRDATEYVARIEHTLSYSSDTPDFWRRNQQPYPEHANRFTGVPAYFEHVSTTIKMILKETATTIQDFDFVILHQPNSKFPLTIAKQLGITEKQIMPGLLVSSIGNTYSASSPLSLTAVLDNAKPNQRILLVSYGSGSGCDAFTLKTTSLLQQKQSLAKKTNEYINNKKYLSYEQYKRQTS